jgi:fucose 4-O-acetylase-like acetyltransferase
MKTITLYPHPNYLKVANTYVWLASLAFTFLILTLIDNTFYKILGILLLFFFTIFVIQRIVENFSKKRTIVQFEKNLILIDGKRIEKNHLRFKSFFLEKAYGIGCIYANGVTIRAVDASDWKKYFED